MGRIALDPSKTKALIENLQSTYEEMTENGYPPVLLCSSKIRMPVRKILERSIPQMSVISYNEVPTSIEAQSIAMIQI
jgi:flagellar biosynthesis protein FlhA